MAAERFSDEQWDRLTDALVAVFGAGKVDVEVEQAVYRRDGETFLVVHRDRRVEGSMPLHETMLEGVEGVSVEDGAVTFHAADGRYTYRRPF